uniref:Uncharacterized protein n=1 Tax=Arundo donax TaxID=35708 RepID=A0A0A9BHP2_ARUDO
MCEGSTSACPVVQIQQEWQEDEPGAVAQRGEGHLEPLSLPVLGRRWSFATREVFPRRKGQGRTGRKEERCDGV